jgi:IS5 family transposase
VDRRKQGLKRSILTDAGGIPLAATLDAVGLLGPLPQRPTVHLDAGYDFQPCRQVLAERGMAGEIATRGKPAPVQASRRWPVERTHARATACRLTRPTPLPAGSLGMSPSTRRRTRAD